MQKFAGPFVGAPFLWGPCSAEHAEHAKIRLWGGTVGVASSCAQLGGFAIGARVSFL